jgi:hypothetical protein
VADRVVVGAGSGGGGRKHPEVVGEAGAESDLSAVDLQDARPVGCHVGQGDLITRHQAVVFQVLEHLVVELDVL